MKERNYKTPRIKMGLDKVQYDSQVLSKEQIGNYLRTARIRSLPVVADTTGTFQGKTISASSLAKQQVIAVLQKDIQYVRVRRTIPKVFIVQQEEIPSAISLVEKHIKPLKPEMIVGKKPIAVHAPSNRQIVAFVVTNPDPDDDPPPVND